MTRPAGFLSVMAGRRSPPDELDYFPTPPWATRAFVRHVLDVQLPISIAQAAAPFDPCAGEGHMIETLRENHQGAVGSDIFDYGCGYPVADALEASTYTPSRFVITNPPFNIALEIVLTALAAASPAVFVLVRSSWLEGEERYARLFQPFPPTVVANYVERVPMVKGRYDPRASTATAYSWVGWIPSAPDYYSRHLFIPPSKRECFRTDDIRRWCAPADAPLFGKAL